MILSSVVGMFNRLAPTHLGEKWDNVGLLVEPSKSKTVSTIFLTNDLTEPVLEEALQNKADVIYSYHPPIFSAIKKLCNTNWKDRIILRCIENQIAIYSPHTALDAVTDGVNDWLLNCFDVSSSHPLIPSKTLLNDFTHCLDVIVSNDYDLETLQNIKNVSVSVLSTDGSRKHLKVLLVESCLELVMKYFFEENSMASSITVTKLTEVPLLNTGAGRFGKLTSQIKLVDAVQLVKHYLGLEHVRVAQAVNKVLDDTVSTVAVCAGSGSSVLSGHKADLYVTGEMSHHDVLNANHCGTSVILCEHSNTERGFLRHLANRMQKTFPDLKILVSQVDSDPLKII